MPNVYLSIGNSDDKLTQAEWSEYVRRVQREAVILASRVHGEWFSGSASPWQNACWCLEFGSDEDMEAAREAVTAIRALYRQDSAAWAVAEPEFI